VAKNIRTNKAVEGKGKVPPAEKAPAFKMARG
jgi:hypothetical protein